MIEQRVVVLLLYHLYFFDFLFNLRFFPLFFIPFLTALNLTDFFIFLSCGLFRCLVSFGDFFATFVLISVSECLLFFPNCVASLDFLLRAFGKSSNMENKETNNSLDA